MTDPYREADRLQAIETRLRENTAQTEKLEKATFALVKTVDDKLHSPDRQVLAVTRWIGVVSVLLLVLGFGNCATSTLRDGFACAEACGERGVASFAPESNSRGVAMTCTCIGEEKELPQP